MSAAETVRVARLRNSDPTDARIVQRLLAEYLMCIREPDDARARHHWLYLENPDGEAVTLVAFDAAGNPVGMTSLFPREVIVAGRTRRGAIGGDAYVRAKLRGRGIGIVLHQAALAAMTEGGVEFMFGPPEPTNLRALCRAGAVVTGSVKRWVRFPAARALNRGASKTIRAFELGAEPDPRAEDAWEAVRESEAGPARVLASRGARYCAWRYGRSPSRRQRAFVLSDQRGVPIGLASLELGLRRAAIVDFVAARGYAREAMSAVIDLCAGSDTIEFALHAPAVRMELCLVSLGFIPRASKPFQVQAPVSSSDRDVLLRAAAWHYTRGDGDLDRVLA